MSDGLLGGGANDSLPGSSFRALRRSVPILLFAAFCMWLATLVGEQGMWLHYRDSLQWSPLKAAACTCILLVCSLVALLNPSIRRKKIIFTFVISFAFVSLGLICSLLYWYSWEMDAKELGGEKGGLHRFEATSDPKKTDFGFVSQGVLITSEGSRIAVRLYWQSEDECVPSGTSFSAYGKPRIPVGNEAGRYAHRNGLCGSITVYSPRDSAWANSLRGYAGPLRGAVKESILAYEGDGAALLCGVLLGDTTQLSGSICEEDFRLCGLAHLIAVSGSHLVVVSALLSLLFSSLRIPRILSIVVLAIALLFYVVFSGVQISAVRSCVMAVLGLFSGIAGRRRDSASSCSLCVCVFIASNPSAVFSFSLQLSLAAVLGIIYFSTYFEEWLVHLLPGEHRKLASALALTSAAQITTLPLTVPLFSQIPLVAPLANILVTPLITLLLSGGLGAAIFLGPLPSVSGFVLALVIGVGDMTVRAVGVLASIPHASIAVSASQTLLGILCFGSLIVLWSLWLGPTCSRVAKVRVSLIILCVCVVIVSSVPPPPGIVILDVGQGDAILVRDKGATVLVDTGDDEAALLKALAEAGVSHLDAVVITHFHTDHYAALSALGRIVTVEKVMFSNIAFDGAYAGNEAMELATRIVGEDYVLPLSVGDVLEVGRIRLAVLSPESYTQEGGNDDSICLKLEYDDDQDGDVEISGLFTGDAEEDVIERICSDKAVGDVDFLKVGHHGSANSTTGSALDTLEPELAFISVGKQNEYGLPAQVTIDLLSFSSTHLYRTDLNGTIRVVFSESSLKVSCDTMTDT